MDTVLGRQIKALRKANHWTTHDLSGKLIEAGAGVTWRTIEHWEQGLRCPRPEAMAALIALGLERKEA
jgi:DNA-binding transcriptional regulator YiaG